MNKEKLISKGYTLSVTSWENDGDYNATNSMTFDDNQKELVIAIARMCRDIFQSINNREQKGIGNTDDRTYSKSIVLEYMKNHPELYENIDNPSDDKLVRICMEYNYNLLGSSEYYYSRVFESATITYSPEDIYLETIEF